MSREDSGALLDELVDHIDRCPSYNHSWDQNELIRWDDWRMLHPVTGGPTDKVCSMRRTMISGEHGSGRALTYADAV
ncbi:MAG TPA: hypothetical protein VFP14_01215 [Novosphingobium sp.]|nr:hypothetical protein [Novosphingobium sp.]